jgi:hypothetical protein
MNACPFHLLLLGLGGIFIAPITIRQRFPRGPEGRRIPFARCRSRRGKAVAASWPNGTNCCHCGLPHYRIGSRLFQNASAAGHLQFLRPSAFMGNTVNGVGAGVPAIKISGNHA